MRNKLVLPLATSFGIVLLAGPSILAPHIDTIFVLADTSRAMFCDNEAWSDAKTRIWFLPADGLKWRSAWNVAQPSPAAGSGTVSVRVSKTGGETPPFAAGGDACAMTNQ